MDTDTAYVKNKLTEKRNKPILSMDDYDWLDEWEWDNFKYDFVYMIQSYLYYKWADFVILGYNMTWRGISGHAQATSEEKILEKFEFGSDYKLDFYKGDEPNTIQVIRYSHDEPTGARFTIMTRSKAEREYNFKWK